MGLYNSSVVLETPEDTSTSHTHHHAAELAQVHKCTTYKREASQPLKSTFTLGLWLKTLGHPQEQGRPSAFPTTVPAMDPHRKVITKPTAHFTVSWLSLQRQQTKKKKMQVFELKILGCTQSGDRQLLYSSIILEELTTKSMPHSRQDINSLA